MKHLDWGEDQILLDQDIDAWVRYQSSFKDQEQTRSFVKFAIEEKDWELLGKTYCVETFTRKLVALNLGGR